MILWGEQVYYWLDVAKVDPDIVELDIVVAVMTLITLIHAVTYQHKTFFVLLVLMAHVVEQSSIRLGGTHCHKPGVLNVGVCQSANSVWLYIPWFYSAFHAAMRMVRKGFSAVRGALLAGCFSFAFCGAYEMQGPILKWWQWPDAEKITSYGVSLWQLEPDPQGRGLLVSDHANAALLERVFEFPVTAPLYHVAMLIGLVQALQLTHLSLSLDQLKPANTLFAFFFIGPLALLWDLPVRFLEWGGVSKFVSAPCIMLLVLLVPVFTQPSQPRKRKSLRVESDFLLFSIPLINSTFLCSRFWMYPGIVPPDLYMMCVSLTVIALLAHFRAAIASPGSSKTKSKTQ